MYKLLAIASIVIVLAGCTRSLTATYTPGGQDIEHSIRGQQLAVYQFEDTRAWIDESDSNSKAYIAHQGSWRFGLTYENVEFNPVANILQNIIIDEFNSVGVNAVRGEGAMSPDYLLKGKIINFEFENELGVWTVTSRRQVSLSLTLINAAGQKLLANEFFNEVNRENEGMGVMHTTNVDKLMKVTLKNVLNAILKRTNEQLLASGASVARVVLNGVEVTSQLVDSHLVLLDQ